MNKLDGELVRSALHESGYEFTEASEEAGVILFITCSVRDHAETRVHSRISQLKAWKKDNPAAILGVMGCMAQEHGEALIKAHGHVDLVVGTRDFPYIADLLQRVRGGEKGLVAVASPDAPAQFRNEELRPQRFKAFLSIMRGCDQYCAYCIVPYVRGRESSRPMAEIVEEARRLVSSGVKEITLLGQTVNHYDDGRGHRLAQLLGRLETIEDLFRLSFVTSYPAYLDEPLMDAVAASSKISRSLHLPAQSGSNRMLKRMNRKYTAEFYLQTVERMREKVPDMEFASDFIVGFPGEEEEDFAATERLMQAVGFQQSFIFKYSPRPGTVAAKKFPDDVPETVKKDRNQRLLDLQERLSREKNQALIDTWVEVLVEGVSPRDSARYIGRTRHNRIAAFPASPEMVGKRVRVKVTDTTALTLLSDQPVEVVQ